MRYCGFGLIRILLNRPGPQLVTIGVASVRWNGTLNATVPVQPHDPGMGPAAFTYFGDGSCLSLAPSRALGYMLVKGARFHRTEPPFTNSDCDAAAGCKLS